MTLVLSQIGNQYRNDMFVNRELVNKKAGAQNAGFWLAAGQARLLDRVRHSTKNVSSIEMVISG